MVFIDPIIKAVVKQRCTRRKRKTEVATVPETSPTSCPNERNKVTKDALAEGISHLSRVTLGILKAKFSRPCFSCLGYAGC